ncbi:hypothetical protein V8G54_028774 [Vigna mungo]|uniref:Uncharacterized protein n=1 Tax=Vigna mungo TaxID=3915 RepID=A0AAQ3MTE4_VIGMU
MFKKLPTSQSIKTTTPMTKNLELQLHTTPIKHSMQCNAEERFLKVGTNFQSYREQVALGLGGASFQARYNEAILKLLTNMQASTRTESLFTHKKTQNYIPN